MSTAAPTEKPADSPAPPADAPARAAKKRKYIEPAQWDQRPVWEIIESVPDDNWGTLVQGYVYRHEPTYTPTQKGDGSYILKFVEAITQDDVKERFGSGAYAVRLVDRDGDKKKYQKFEIIDADHPPKLPNPEWKEHGVNRRWIFGNDDAKPAATADDSWERAEKIVRLMQQSGGAKGPSDVQVMADRLDKLNERIIEVITHQPDRTEQAFKLLETAKGLMPTPPAPVEDKLTPMLLDLLLKREQQTPTPADPVAQMRQTLELMRELKDEAQPQPPSDGPAWLGPAVQTLGPALAAILGAVVHKLTGGPDAPAQQPQHAQPAGPQQIAAGQPQQPQQQPAPQPEQDDPNVFLIRQILPIIAQPLLNFATADDKDGGDFADFMLEGYNAQLVAQAQAVPKETWAKQIMATPELWQPLQQGGVDEAKLLAFIEQFQAFGQEE